MYYLLNQTNQIIAADEGLLALCGVFHIDELSSKIILGDSIFNLTEETLTINDNPSYAVSKTLLSSMLGDLILVTLTIKNVVETHDKLIDLSEENFPNDLMEEDEDIAPLDLPTSVIDDDLLFPEEETKEDVLIIPEYDDDILFPEEETKEDVLIIPEDTEEILIDIENISQEIGVSHEDYNAFVDEYIDTALGLESDLQSEDKAKRTDTIAVLSQLADVLHLPVINTIIKKLSTASKNEQKEIIISFYNTLSRLTTQTTPQKVVLEKETLKEKEEEDTPFELFDMPRVEPEVSKEEKPKETGGLTSFGTINLEGIKPIHFDFQLEEAANDLSLPVELIEEFVNDFIEQGHKETKKMLEAYEKGDLDAIQKIGHLLKGASSNLRINALSDTLYQIQFCEDPSNLETFIKEYWGHFLSFEIQINVLAK